MAKGIRKATEETPEVVEQQEYNPFAKQHYEEWTVQVQGDKIERLKLKRARVMITEAQAETLNEGVTEGKLNQYASMYFKPE